MNTNDEIYICSSGETFDSIALEIYGDEKYACELFSANPEYVSIPIFYGGEILDIPEIDIPEKEDDEESYVSSVAPWKAGDD